VYETRRKGRVVRVEPRVIFGEEATVLAILAQSPVIRTLRWSDPAGRWPDRTPAMPAGLADHVWSLAEWLSFPAAQQT